MRALARALPLLVLAVGCGGPKGYVAKPVPKVEAADPAALTADNLMPLKQGNEWVFDYETVTRVADRTVPENGRLAFRVLRALPLPNGGTRATIGLYRNEQEVDRQIWVVNDKGLYQESGRIKDADVPFSPPQPFILLPIKGNETFKWKGTGVCPNGLRGTMTATAKVLGPQEVDTNRGRKSAIAVENLTDFAAGKAKGGLAVTTWYQPGVGIVRLKQTMAVPAGTITSTLKLYKGPA